MLTSTSVATIGVLFVKKWLTITMFDIFAKNTLTRSFCQAIFQNNFLPKKIMVQNAFFKFSSFQISNVPKKQAKKDLRPNSTVFWSQFLFATKFHCFLVAISFCDQIPLFFGRDCFF